ncbi:outer membrane lipoprotein-sorting protein [Burkholderia vietnamiensis]|uniref:outer membrane lipoprotein-sorting protein n=1 Tax=Burkholderia vietnamiensis TaxID=60552 RepID=UPI001D15B568|nr:outer membrane lipoprotein-sorting protein [Burkholderia vietnamiensis]UEC00538.1 outer membrane lipoprotein-sorting protein [Burkholderia vietnamiensis]
MIAALLAASLIGASMTADPVTVAHAHFEQVHSYRATIRSSARSGEHAEIHYAYLKPGFVRMDFVSPHHGAVLAYDPGDGKVRLRPFGEHVPPALTLSPANPLVRDHSGHRVDRSDVGELLRNVQALQQGGATVTEGEETIGGRAALRVTVTGAPAHAVDGVHRYRLWLAADDGFPLKVVSFADGDGEPLETVTLDDVEIDVAFPARFFAP